MMTVVKGLCAYVVVNFTFCWLGDVFDWSASVTELRATHCGVMAYLAILSTEIDWIKKGRL